MWHVKLWICYMMFGLPVICSNDVTSFATAINVLSGSDSIRHQMGKNNREVAKKFDVEILKIELMKIYNEVLENE